MKEELIKVVLCKVGERAKVVTIPNNLETFQKIVNDIISLFFIDDQHAIICGDNSKIYGYPLNRCVFDEKHKPIEIIAGDFLIVDASDEDFKSLTSNDAVKLAKQYEWPEDIFLVGNEIMSFPYDPAKW